jgi:hypothetical protein
MSKSTTRWAMSLPLLLAIGIPPASATLGGAANTVNADEAKLQAVRHVARSAATHELHELTLASGTIVREYVAPSGAVFAVTWQGPFKPDLEQLLGAYFPRLVAAGQLPRADHRALAVRAPDVVIESGGRMRAFTGRAYLPEMVPATVSVGELR